MKKCSTSVVIGEVQMKTPVRCPFTDVRAAAIRDKRKQVLARVWGEGTLCSVGGNVSWYSHYRKQCGGSSEY